VFEVPDHYMMQATVQLDPQARTRRWSFREQPGLGRRLPAGAAARQGEAEINGPGFSYPRRCVIDAAKPVTIQAFVQGTMIETFINDAYAFSCRAYNFPSGRLGLNVAGGSAACWT
jgi:hypothetical protein